jgi:hypothetical protein
MDSFLRESARFNSTGLRKCVTVLAIEIYANLFTVGIIRTAQKRFQFRDGTVIPAGAVVAAPAYSLHNDPELYPNPEVFDAFRFSNLRESSTGGLKHQVVRTAPNYLPFGHGRHAWYDNVPCSVISY